MHKRRYDPTQEQLKLLAEEEGDETEEDKLFWKVEGENEEEEKQEIKDEKEEEKKGKLVLQEITALKKQKKTWEVKWETYSFVDRLGRLRRRLDIRSEGALHFAAWRDTAIRELVQRLILQKEKVTKEIEGLHEKARDARAVNYVLKGKLDESQKELDTSLSYERQLKMQVERCENVYDELLRQRAQSKEVVKMFSGITQVVARMFSDDVDRVVRLGLQNPALIGSSFEPLQDAHIAGATSKNLLLLRHGAQTVSGDAEEIARLPGRLTRKNYRCEKDAKALLTRDGITPDFKKSTVEPLYYWMAYQTEEWQNGLHIVQRSAPQVAYIACPGASLNGNGGLVGGGDAPSSVMKRIVVEECEAEDVPQFDRSRNRNVRSPQIRPTENLYMSDYADNDDNFSLGGSPSSARNSKHNSITMNSARSSIVAKPFMNRQPSSPSQPGSNRTTGSGQFYTSKRKTVLGSMHFGNGVLEKLEAMSDKEKLRSNNRDTVESSSRNTVKDITMRAKTSLDHTMDHVYGGELYSMMLRRSSTVDHIRMDDSELSASIENMQQELETLHEKYSADKEGELLLRENEEIEREFQRVALLAEQNVPEETEEDTKETEEPEDTEEKKGEGKVHPSSSQSLSSFTSSISLLDELHAVNADAVDQIIPRSLYQVEEMGVFVRNTIPVVEAHQKALFDSRHGLSAESSRRRDVKIRGSGDEAPFASVDKDVYDSVVCFLANMTPSLPHDNDPLLSLKEELYATAEGIKDGPEDISHYKQMEAVVSKFKGARQELQKKRASDMSMHSMWTESVNRATDDVLSRLVNRLDLHNPTRNNGFDKTATGAYKYDALQQELVEAVLHDHEGYLEWAYAHEEEEKAKAKEQAKAKSLEPVMPTVCEEEEEASAKSPQGNDTMETNTDPVENIAEETVKDEGELDEEKKGEKVIDSNETADGDDDSKKAVSRRREEEDEDEEDDDEEEDVQVKPQVDKSELTCTLEEASVEATRCSEIIGSFYLELKKLFVDKTNSLNFDADTTMSNLQFWRVIRQKKIVGKRCSSSFIELLYIDQVRRRKLALLNSIRDGNGIVSSVQGLSFDNFIHILVLIAQEKYFGEAKLSERLQTLLLNDILSDADDQKSPNDTGFRDVLASSRIEHVFEIHTEWLNVVFMAYAMDDLEDRDNLASMNIKEFQLFVNDAKLINKGILGFKQVQFVFECVQSDEGIGGEDDDCGGDNQMVYYEFLESVAVLASYAFKNPYMPLEGKIDDFITTYLKGAPSVQKKRKEFLRQQ